MSTSYISNDMLSTVSVILFASVLRRVLGTLQCSSASVYLSCRISVTSLPWFPPTKSFCQVSGILSNGVGTTVSASALILPSSIHPAISFVARGICGMKSAMLKPGVSASSLPHLPSSLPLSPSTPLSSPRQPPTMSRTPRQPTHPAYPPSSQSSPAYSTSPPVRHYTSRWSRTTQSCRAASYSG